MAQAADRGHAHLSATKEGSDQITTILEKRLSLPPLRRSPVSEGNLTAVFHMHVLSQKWDPPAPSRDPSLRTVDTDNKRALSAATYQTLAYALHICANPIPTALRAGTITTPFQAEKPRLGG